MIRVADYIMKFLVDKGVEDIFLLTGNGAMYLNDGIASQPSIKYYCARNEAASPMMAEAYARLKQSLGAVCLTSGPGSTNAIPGLAEAYVDAAPILILSGQAPRNHTTHNMGISGLRSFGTAEIDIIPIVSSLTKYAVMVNDPSSIRYHLEKAVYLATSGRPGPVWLDIPMDVQFALINPDELVGFNPSLLLSIKNPLASNLEKDIDLVLKMMSQSRKPLIVAGYGIRQGNAINEFKKFLTLFNAPVVLSRLGIDILSFSHPNNMGLAGIKGTRYCKKIMRSADLIICLGSRLAVPFVGHNLDAFSADAKRIVVDIEPAELKKSGIVFALPINADVKTVIDRLITKLSFGPLNFKPWLNYCQNLKESYPMLTEDMKKNPINLYYFMSKLDAVSDARNVLITDAGSNYYVGGQVFRFEKGQRELTSGTFAAMGLTIPLAIGASIAKKDAQILAVTGDGSLELNIQELKTISYYRLNIKLFVINNGGYVSMRNWQDNVFDGRRIGSDNETGAESLNLAKIADAFDLNYVAITCQEEIDEKLKTVMSDDQPVFIEVFCDNNQKIVEPLDHDKIDIEPEV